MKSIANKTKFFLIIFSSCLFNLINWHTQAQPSAAPATDMILFDLYQEDTSVSISNPRLLNSFNIGQYNNQPVFINAHTVYFSAITEQGSQSDLFAVDLLRKKYWQVTSTPDGEYSPTPMKEQTHISAVRQEFESNTQKLWAFPVDQKSHGYDLLPHITGIGYFAWLNEEEVALYIVENPNQLIIANRNTKEEKFVISNIGRGLKTNNKGLLYFIHKESSEEWFLKSYHPETGSIRTLVKTPGKSEDFEILKDGSIIMGSSNSLYVFHPLKSDNWKKIASLKSFGMEGITRIAVFGNKLIVVTNHK